MTAAGHAPPGTLMIAVMLAVLLAALDQTIVATALPRISDTLGGQEWYAWVFTSYMVATLVVVPIAGALGDLRGRRPVLLAGVAIFLMGSWLAGGAADMPRLVAWRAVQGIGAGIVTANSFALLGDLFAPARVARATGTLTAVYGLAGVLGPPLGGVLTDTLGWRWIFWGNVPVSLLVLVILWRQLPPPGPGVRHPVDVAGAVWMTGFLLPSIALLGWAGEGFGIDAPRMQVAFALALPCAVMFLRTERRAARPLIDLRLFGQRDFTLSMTGMFSVALAMYAALTYAPLLFQTGMQMTPTQSGLVTAPLVLALAIAAALAGRLAEAGTSSRSLTVTGVLLAALAMVWLAGLSPDTGRPVVAASMALMGLGLGLTMPPLLLLAQSSAGHEHLGVATALAKFFRSVGGLMGVALAGALIRHYQGSTSDTSVLSHVLLWAAGVMLLSVCPAMMIRHQPPAPGNPP